MAGRTRSSDAGLLHSRLGMVFPRSTMPWPTSRVAKPVSANPNKLPNLRANVARRRRWERSWAEGWGGGEGRSYERNEFVKKNVFSLVYVSLKFFNYFSLFFFWFFLLFVFFPLLFLLVYSRRSVYTTSRLRLWACFLYIFYLWYILYIIEKDW